MIEAGSRHGLEPGLEAWAGAGAALILWELLLTWSNSPGKGPARKRDHQVLLRLQRKH